MRNENEGNDLTSRVERHEIEIKQLAQGLATLTVDVRDLTHAVGSQTRETAKQFSDVLIAINAVSAPRPMDKQLIISFIMLVITIGALVFIPLNWRQQVTQDDVNIVLNDFKTHTKLTLHPVGAEKVSAIEKTLTERYIRNFEDIKALDTKLQKEYELVDKAGSTRYSDLSTLIKESDSRLQNEIKILRDQFLDVQQNGSPILRERTSVLEAKISDIAGHLKEKSR